MTLLWSSAVFFAGLSLRHILPDLDVFSGAFRLTREKRELEAVTQRLLRIEETLLSGVVPASAEWDALASLPEPWGRLASEAIRELRSSGAAVIPTLRRLRELSERHSAALAEARAKSAQSLAQAASCAALVPVFGVVLFALVPGVPEYPRAWLGVCAVALAFSMGAACWMMSLADQARWAGLPAELRPWLLAAQCAGERFLALVRAGTPVDLAFARACSDLGGGAAELGRHWGHSVWKHDEGKDPRSSKLGTSAQLLVELGTSIRRAAQISLMEGTPCAPRVEAALLALGGDLKAAMDHEVSLLTTRCLLPLFCLVAPALVSMLVAAFAIAWLSSGIPGAGL